ncbi:MAG: YgiT-type zinc finger protein [Acidobacteria bacterium]|nr:YgiT-type zinc finger protein [Acidobacteriota bacterium]
MATVKITICPTCGGKRIRLLRQNWTGSFQGQTYTVPDLEFYECPDCGERLFDREAMRKIEAHSPAYSKLHQRKKSA